MKLFLKRLMDIVLSSIALIVFIPLFLIISILIKLDSKGPIFFIQERRTKNGKIFKMYKFRSMCIGAEKLGTGLFNFKNDSRITRIGNFLRKSSLDELPQLFNVIKGDISLVGPRPCVTYELGDFETLNKKYKKRFEMLAGITGLAQVRGRNENSWEEKVQYDNEYIELFKKYGIFIDIKIIFETIIGVFKAKDICEQKIDDSVDDVEAARLAEEEIIRLAHLPDEE
jgi:lipopolysaccharide/colanic/teichoic acid biosynthesis glycosyltransferase